MIVPIPRSHRTSEENVLPLINIVFLLLIFFMIAGALSVTAPFPLDPPATRAAAASEAPREGVAIGADGELAFGGDVIRLDQLGARVATWREESNGNALLSVRADEAAGTGHLLEVIEVLRDAGVESFRLLSIGDSGDS
jgi:biopolymer transport protein ExbD